MATRNIGAKCVRARAHAARPLTICLFAHCRNFARHLLFFRLQPSSRHLHAFSPRDCARFLVVDVVVSASERGERRFAASAARARQDLAPSFFVHFEGARRRVACKRTCCRSTLKANDRRSTFFADARRLLPPHADGERAPTRVRLLRSVRNVRARSQRRRRRQAPKTNRRSSIAVAVCRAARVDMRWRQV